MIPTDSKYWSTGIVLTWQPERPGHAEAWGAREIAQKLLQRQVRACWADLIDGDTIATELDALTGRGRIRGYDYDALSALRDAVLAELADAASQGHITVTITGPSA